MRMSEHPPGADRRAVALRGLNGIGHRRGLRLISSIRWAGSPSGCAWWRWRRLRRPGGRAIRFIGPSAGPSRLGLASGSRLLAVLDPGTTRCVVARRPALCDQFRSRGRQPAASPARQTSCLLPGPQECPCRTWPCASCHHAAGSRPAVGHAGLRSRTSRWEFAMAGGLWKQPRGRSDRLRAGIAIGVILLRYSLLEPLRLLVRIAQGIGRRSAAADPPDESPCSPVLQNVTAALRSGGARRLLEASLERRIESETHHVTLKLARSNARPGSTRLPGWATGGSWTINSRSSSPKAASPAKTWRWSCSTWIISRR